MYPRTFAEFYQSHSGFIPALCVKHKWCAYADVADLANEIYGAMILKQVVESFDPSVYGDAVNVKIFMGYIKLCVTRMVQTLRTLVCPIF